MVKVLQELVQKENGSKGIYMDGYLKQNLDSAKVIIRKDWDFVIIVTGIEGSGKSVLAQQMARYVDPDFCLGRITFTPSQFGKAIDNCPRYGAVIYDEAYDGLSSKRSMSEVNHALVARLTRIRQKNLFVFVLMPSFFDLDKYPALHRSRALVHVHTEKGMERGYFKFYSMKKKKKLYLFGKKSYDYGVVKADFHGRFMDGYMVDEAQYRALKLTVEQDRTEVVETKYKVQRDAYLYLMHKQLGLSQSEISEITKKLFVGTPFEAISITNIPTIYYAIESFRKRMCLPP